MSSSWKIPYTGARYVVMRAVRLGASGNHSDEAFLDPSSARFTSNVLTTIGSMGAWPGDVFGLWELDHSYTRSKAMEMAQMVTPDMALVMTNLGGLLAEVDLDVVRDLPILPDDVDRG